MMRKEKQKQNIISSQNQSMLVSQRKPCESIIKMSMAKCDCLNILKNIQTKLQLFQLRLQEMSANVNICFTKQMQYYGKLVQEQKKRQHIQYTVWDLKEISQAIQEKVCVQVNKQQQSIGNLSEEVQTWIRTLRDMKNWKSNHTTWSNNLQKNLYDVFKTHRQENDQKIRKIYEAVEEIGILQRKMLQRSQNSGNQKKSRAISYNNDRNSIPHKKSIISYNPNESTMIYASRHCYK